MAHEPQKERILSLDIIKCLAIFLVLWGHAIQHLLQSPAQDNYLFRFISAFHMPLFMSIAGFFAVNAHRHPPFRFLFKKGFELLLPAISMSVLLLAIRWMMHGCNGIPDITGFTAWFWFLKSLFICFFLYVVALQFRSHMWTALAAMLLISQCIGYCGVNRMFPFFLSGIALRNFFPAIQRHSLPIALSSALAFIVLLTGWDASFFGIPGGFHPLMDFLSGKNPGYLFHNAYIYAIGISGTIFVLTSVDLLTRKAAMIPCMGIMSKIGRNTIGIYILQVIVLENVMANFFKLDYLDSEVFNWIVAPLLSLAVLYLCMLAIRLLRKNPVSLFLLGETAADRQARNLKKQ